LRKIILDVIILKAAIVGRKTTEIAAFLLLKNNDL
jgi:hypothetical protein